MEGFVFGRFPPEELVFPCDPFAAFGLFMFVLAVLFVWALGGRFVFAAAAPLLPAPELFAGRLAFVFAAFALAFALAGRAVTTHFP